MAARSLIAMAVALGLTGGPAGADHVPEVMVFGHPVDDASGYPAALNTDLLVTPDAAEIMKQVPGGNVNYNGQLSSQTQYRGMFGPRMNVRIDGMVINSGGPNLMDPPLHYLPASLVRSFRAVRGIASVSSGPGIGGAIEAVAKSSRFTDGSDWTTQGDVVLGGRSADDGSNLAAVLGLANARHRAHVLAAKEDGDDLDFGDGTIAASGYARDFYGLGYGYRAGEHELSIDVRHNRTDDSGNPVLPLDLALFDADLINVQYAGKFGAAAVEAALFYAHIDHRMTNYLLRPPPDFSALPLPPFLGTDRRFVAADAQGLGWRLQALLPLGSGELRVGADGHRHENNAEVFDPDFAPFFVTNFNDVRSDRYGVFAEWDAELGTAWHLELGARHDWVQMETGPVDAFPARIASMFPPGSPPQAVRALRDRFNAADRTQEDGNVDVVARLSYALNDSQAVEFGFARKTRSPNYQERFLWIPLEVNSGLGDGNNYVGNVDLHPEVSYQVEAALNWRGERMYLLPRMFYRRVDDYIQGVPVAATPFNLPVIGVSANANGDPTPLQFANVDAELYGIDLAWGYAVQDHWRLDGVLNYVRGKRRDIDDELFRIAPLNARLSLTHHRHHWLVTLEGVLYARQTRISQALTNDPANPNNSNRETPGYGLLNLYGQTRFYHDRLAITAGVRNLLDKAYVDHLSGFNRVAGGDVAIGQRLPGPGLNLFGTVSVRW